MILDKVPVAGVDYPRTLQEFDEWFSCEEKCINFLQQLRWPDGFCCPACKECKAWSMSRNVFWCVGCGRQTSLTAGTLFEGTRKPLRLWFQAMWYITSQKFGGNALGLQRILGLGSYQTAWSWLHKMRRAMVCPGRDRLNGNIEVDETYLGGVSRGGKRGRGTEKKSIVVIAVEMLSPKGFGRIRMRRTPDVSGESLIPFINDTIEPGAVVITDGWKGYNDLPNHGYTRKEINISDSGDPAHIAMPGVHRIAALSKRWLLGIHQGAVSEKHLDYYLDEYVFRFNRRKSKARGLLFYRLLQQAVKTGSTTYNQLIRVAARDPDQQE